VTRAPRDLLLTGVPGVGKTTVIRRVAEGLPGMHPGGFYTQEIRTAGERQGFCLTDFQGRKRLIAHIGLPKRCRVGKYGVDVAAIDSAAEALLAHGREAAIYLVDEIGKMECYSPRFVSGMRLLLASSATVIATVAKKGSGFITEVKQRSDCLMWEITRENRAAMPQRVLRWLGDGEPG
jgi:nucleoside-triphosphatase